VDHRDTAGRVEMRVGVLIGRLAVRGPACVGDADAALYGVGRHFARDALIDLAELLPNAESAVIEHRDPRTVIATVLQAAQSLEQHR